MVLTLGNKKETIGKYCQSFCGEGLGMLSPVGLWGQNSYSFDFIDNQNGSCYKNSRSRFDCFENKREGYVCMTAFFKQFP